MTQDANPNRRHALMAIGATLAGAGLSTPFLAMAETNASKKTGIITPQDFGAVGDGIADDTAALQAAIDSAHTQGRILYIPAGHYRITQTLRKLMSFDCPTIIGEGQNKTIFDYSTIKKDACLYIQGGSGTGSQAIIQGIRFKGNASTSAIEIDGQNQLTVHACRFERNANGILLHNKTQGSFTEFINAFNCFFTGQCLTPMRLKRAKGNDSFHGCRIDGGSIMQSAGDNLAAIVIEPDCFLYGAKFDLTVFVTHNNYKVFDNQSTKSSYLSNAAIQFEVQAGNLIISSGKRLPIAGTLTGIGPKGTQGYPVQHGSALLCTQVSLDPSGSFQLLGAQTASKALLNTSTFKAPSTGLEETCRIAYIQINGAHHNLRFTLLLSPNGFGAKGYVTALEKTIINNTANLNIPNFELDAYGRLLITSSSYTDERPATLIIHQQQLSGVINGSGAIYA